MDRAGDRYFQRGVYYFEEGRVHALAQYGDRITAKVYGTQTYKVDLWLEDDDLVSNCTCPLGDEGLFCQAQTQLRQAPESKRANPLEPMAEWLSYSVSY